MIKKNSKIKIFLTALLISVSFFSCLQLTFADNPATTAAKGSKAGTTEGSKATADGSVTPEELFHQFTYTNSGDKGTNIGAVNAIASKQSWQTVLANIIKMLLNVSGGLALIAFTIAGVLMVTARGKPDVFDKGKKLLMAAIMGLVIIAVSYALVIGVSNLQFFTAGTPGGTQPSGDAKKTPTPAPQGQINP